MLYVNPGYVELLNGVYTGSTILNSETLYFTNTNRTTNIKFDSVKELWIKGKFTVGSSVIRFYIIDKSATVGFRTDFSSDNVLTGYILPFNNVSNSTAIIPTFGKLIVSHEYDFLMHVKSDDTTGEIEIYLNNVLQYSYSGDKMKGLTFSSFTIVSVDSDTYFRDIIIADFDITDYYIAPCTIKSYDSDFEKQTDGTLKATATGQLLSSVIDSDALKASMLEKVDNPEIVGVNVSAFNVNYDSSVVNTLKSSIDGADSETLTIKNNNVAGNILLTNPALSKAWTLDQLKTAAFKLTADKV